MPENTSYIRFIGREKELAQIEQAINDWNSLHILCIDALGGIGKTRLLQEVRQRYGSKHDPHSPLLITDIIDFDEQSYYSSWNFERKIARMVGEETFKPYITATLDLRKMEDAGISQASLGKQRSESRTSFINCFNEIASQRRVILFYDTVDAVREGVPIWDEILEVSSQYKNTVVFISGREARKLGEPLQAKLHAQVQFVDLPPLSVEDSHSYLQEKNKALHIPLETDLSEKLLLLAGGRPILIDLAVEWRSRNIPFEWLIKSSLEEFRKLNTAQLEERKKEFEKHLVYHLVQPRSKIERLFVMMSRIYPVDVEIITHLFKLSEEEAIKLFKDAKSYVFVKTLPDGRISLHDEMRRMLETYVWEEADPDADQRRHHSEIISAYWDKKIQIYVENLNQLKGIEKSAHEERQKELEINTFVKCGEIEQELWLIRKQWLTHLLFINIDEGVKAFVQLFDEATQRYKFRERDTIVETILPYLQKQLLLEKEYDVRLKLGEHYIDLGKIQNAKDVVQKLIDEYGDDILRSVRPLVLMGNVWVRLGDLPKAIGSFERAVERSKQQHDLNLQATAEHELGWAYRLVSDWQKACFHYREALRISQELNNESEQASILNDLGFAHSYINHHEGISLCFRALEIWTQQNELRGIGRANSTIGNIYYHMNEPHKAVKHFEIALSIFQSQQDYDFLARIYSWIGATHIYLGDLEKAEECLRTSIDMGVEEVKAQVLHRLARVYIAREDFDMAEKFLQQSYTEGQRIYDVLYVLASLRDLVRVAVIKRQFHRYGEFAQLRNEFEERWVWKRRDDAQDEFEERWRWEGLDADAQGGLHLYLAFLVLGQQRRDYSRAKDPLKWAFQNIVKSFRGPQKYLEEADKFLSQEVKKDVLRDIGTELWNTFKGEKDSAFDLALDYFNRWRRADI